MWLQGPVTLEVDVKHWARTPLAWSSAPGLEVRLLLCGQVIEVLQAWESFILSCRHFQQ